MTGAIRKHNTRAVSDVASWILSNLDRSPFGVVSGHVKIQDGKVVFVERAFVEKVKPDPQNGSINFDVTDRESGGGNHDHRR